MRQPLSCLALLSADRPNKNNAAILYAENGDLVVDLFAKQAPVT
jgi:hypothetical protein